MNIRDEILPKGVQDLIDENMNREVGNGPHAYYPLSKSAVDGMWAPGMKSLAQIGPQHDWKMFDKLWW